MLFDFTHTDYGSLAFGFTADKNAGYADRRLAGIDSYRTDGNGQVLSLDISSIDSGYVYSYTGRIAEIKIYKIWLE